MSNGLVIIRNEKEKIEIIKVRKADIENALMVKDL